MLQSRDFHFMSVQGQTYLRVRWLRVTQSTEEQLSHFVSSAEGGFLIKWFVFCWRNKYCVKHVMLSFGHGQHGPFSHRPEHHNVSTSKRLLSMGYIWFCLLLIFMWISWVLLRPLEHHYHLSICLLQMPCHFQLSVYIVGFKFQHEINFTFLQVRALARNQFWGKDSHVTRRNMKIEYRTTRNIILVLGKVYMNYLSGNDHNF